MVNVFLNNGNAFEEVSTDAATSVKVIVDSSPEFNGATILVCFDRQGNEVARFKWPDVAGYAVS